MGERRKTAGAPVSRTTRARLGVVGFLVVSVSGAVAHENERGMDYHTYRNTWGVPCCNNEDCRPATEYFEAFEQGKRKFRLLVDGVWIDVSAGYVIAEDAPDGRAHWCGQKMYIGQHGSWLPATRCLILPPRAM